MYSTFDEIIDSRERLRELITEANRLVNKKAIDHIDPICRRFIAASPFVIVASRGAGSRMDLSPKGDPAGFVAVLDAHTLAIPDRLGNHRVDTFENLLVHLEIIFRLTHGMSNQSAPTARRSTTRPSLQWP